MRYLQHSCPSSVSMEPLSFQRNSSSQRTLISGLLPKLYGQHQPWYSAPQDVQADNIKLERLYHLEPSCTSEPSPHEDQHHTRHRTEQEACLPLYAGLGKANFCDRRWDTHLTHLGMWPVSMVLNLAPYLSPCMASQVTHNKTGHLTIFSTHLPVLQSETGWCQQVKQ